MITAQQVAKHIVHLKRMQKRLFELGDIQMAIDVAGEVEWWRDKLRKLLR